MPSPPRDPLPESTVALFLDPYRFIQKRCRRFGADAFEARIFLESTICVTGPDAARVFYDPELMMRRGAAPLRLQASLLGVGGIQTLDGEEHRRRKAMFLSLTQPEAVARLAEKFEEWLRIYALRWAERDETVVMYGATQEILTRAVCDWAGVPLVEEDVEKRTRHLTALFDGAGAIGPRHWWSRMSRVLAEGWAEDWIEEIRAGRLPLDPERPAAVIARYRDAEGKLLDKHAASVALLNVLRPTVAVAVYLVFVAHALHTHPESRGPIASGDEEYLTMFVEEVRRFYPFFPAAVARVRREFEWNGFTFPEGRRVMLDLYGINHDPRIWDSPDEFRPTRFGETAITPYNFVPQGGGHAAENHRCPGEGIAREVMKAAARFLTREISYDAPPQDLTLQYDRLPALPKSRFLLRDVKPRSFASSER